MRVRMREISGGEAAERSRARDQVRVGGRRNSAATELVVRVVTPRWPEPLQVRQEVGGHHTMVRGRLTAHKAASALRDGVGECPDHVVANPLARSIRRSIGRNANSSMPMPTSRIRKIAAMTPGMLLKSLPSFR
jgi:hypothetical protein